MPWLGALLTTSLMVTSEEFAERRAKLRRALPDAAVVLAGAPDRSPDAVTPPRNDPNFYYLTGWNEPGAMLLLLPGAAEPNEILFLPPRNERRERYEGRRLSANDEGATARTGFRAVMSTDLWESEVKRRTAGVKNVYTLRANREELRRAVGKDDIQDATAAIARLRMVKSVAEIAQLQRAIDVSVEAHLAAWKRAAAGLYEYQIGATMTAEVLDRGCERLAYRPIAGSGPNSTILHYWDLKRRMDGGEILVVDAGAECALYAADLTRTIPVNGRFSAQQREIYELVLGAQKAAIAAVKPGETLLRGAIVDAARQYMDKHGKPIHGKPPSAWFTHGIGHHVGLEVHDSSLNFEPLEAGMVITVEPGIYIPEDNIGVRIEDMVLVTATGSRVLSRALPKDIATIERTMQRRGRR
ncbi:MAG: aminopeptidase P family protein [Acidobacteria bacterium]|nr:aminopeptidase P family protein [Acidobacteriota bacterium]